MRRSEITKDEYDEWRYHYPKRETERFRKEVHAFRETQSRFWVGKVNTLFWQHHINITEKTKSSEMPVK